LEGLLDLSILLAVTKVEEKKQRKSSSELTPAQK
jgi:hypothetical protein